MKDDAVDVVVVFAVVVVERGKMMMIIPTSHNKVQQLSRCLAAGARCLASTRRMLIRNTDGSIKS
jgi:hypothetical protein